MAVDQIALTKKRMQKGSSSLKPLFDWDKEQGFLNRPYVQILNLLTITSVLPKKPTLHPTSLGPLRGVLYKMKGNKGAQTASSHKVPSIMPTWATVP